MRQQRTTTDAGQNRGAAGPNFPSPDAGPGAKGRANAQTQQEGVALFKATGERGFLAADEFYTTTFTTLNGSGVSGEAVIGFDIQTRTITVAISATGLEPNQVHIQHIHGFLDNTEARTPTLAQDDDGDGFIEVAEGADTYGPILLNLTTDHTNSSGSDNGHSHDALAGFPTAPNGSIYFVESYKLPAGLLTTNPMIDLREIVIHGLTVAAGPGAGTPNEIDGTGGYKIALPVASGALDEVDSLSDLRQFLLESDFSAGFRTSNSSQGDLMFG